MRIDNLNDPESARAPDRLRALATQAPLNHTSMSTPGGLRVTGDGYIDGGGVVRVGRLPDGTSGVSIWYKGGQASVGTAMWGVETMASSARDRADAAHTRMDPGGDMNDYVTAVAKATEAARREAAAAAAAAAKAQSDEDTTRGLLTGLASRMMRNDNGLQGQIDAIRADYPPKAYPGGGPRPSES